MAADWAIALFRGENTAKMQERIQVEESHVPFVKEG
jgi:hypothetical protein